MQTHIKKLDEVCRKYTEHEYVNITLLSVAGLLTILAYLSPVINGTA